MAARLLEFCSGTAVIARELAQISLELEDSVLPGTSAGSVSESSLWVA